MRVSISNIGPVNTANINLKPLVMFIGPNNSGKSVIATAIYASLSQTSVATSTWFGRSRRDRGMIAVPGRVVDDTSAFLAGLLDSAAPPTYDQIPSSMLEFFAENLHQSLSEYAFGVGSEMSRTAGVTLQELRRVPTRRPTSATVEVTNDMPEWAIRCVIGSATRYEVMKDVDLQEIWSMMEPAALMDLIARDGSFIGRNEGPARAASLFVRGVTSELTRICFQQIPEHTRYLPAARSGILQSQKALAGSLVRRASLAGALDVQVPALAGVIADFLTEMLIMDPAPSGEFVDEATELERTILQGEMLLQGEPDAPPELVYHTRSGDYPLARASSMVSELAPVVLYLRHLLRKNEILIIEEPEASLHPGSQIAFARSLVHLVNRGLRVVLTTHSEFFLQQINNAIVAANMDEQDAVGAGFRRLDVLPSSDVAAYFFAPSRHGTRVNELRIDSINGISESSFSKVSEHLYEESIALDRSLDGG